MLTEMGQFVRGEEFLRNLLAIVEDETGADSKEAAEIYYQLLVLFYTLGSHLIYCPVQSTIFPIIIFNLFYFFFSRQEIHLWREEGPKGTSCRGCRTLH